MNNIWEYLLIALIAVGGGFVQRTSGFGFGIFVMLFFPYLLPTQSAAAATAGILSCAASTYNMINYRKYLRLKLALPLLLSAAVTIPIAVYFSASAPERLMKTLLGCMLILFSIYFLFFGKRVKLRPTTLNGLLAGGFGGTLAGLFSTGGPPAVLYLVHATSEKSVYFATIQTYFCLTGVYTLILRILNGVINSTVLISGAVGLVGCAIGNFIGSLVFQRLNEQKLKFIIYIGMVISGVLMIL